MAAVENSGVTTLQPNLQKQDLSKLVSVSLLFPIGQNRPTQKLKQF